MAEQYLVKQGEHMSGLAEKFGFSDYRMIWNHPDNAQLKQKCQNPNTLMPGDTVTIPDRTTRTETCPTDQSHKFSTHKSKLLLRVILERSYDKPIADTPCDLIIDAERFSLTSDGTGLVEQQIKRSASDALLVVRDTIHLKDSIVPVSFQVPVRIGDLNPIEERSGQRTRLANLGYYRLDGDDIDEAEFRSAVEEFQCENSLKVDGICGPATKSKLKQRHGC